MSKYFFLFIRASTKFIVRYPKKLYFITTPMYIYDVQSQYSPLSYECQKKFYNYSYKRVMCEKETESLATILNPFLINKCIPYILNSKHIPFFFFPFYSKYLLIKTKTYYLFIIILLLLIIMLTKRKRFIVVKAIYLAFQQQVR